MKLLVVAALFVSVVLSNGYDCSGGACHVTTHASKAPVKQDLVTWTRPEQIKEWHFHVYFFQAENSSVTAAMSVKDALLAEVQAQKFVAIFDGVTQAEFPDLDISRVPPVYMNPDGPHPCGNYEVWVPLEYLGAVTSWFMLNRGELTILVHPLSGSVLEDHTGRNMWIGPPYRLNVAALPVEVPQSHVAGGEYPELKLGYSAPLNSSQNLCGSPSSWSPYAPCNWQQF